MKAPIHFLRVFLRIILDLLGIIPSFASVNLPWQPMRNSIGLNPSSTLEQTSGKLHVRICISLNPHRWEETADRRFSFNLGWKERRTQFHSEDLNSSSLA